MPKTATSSFLQQSSLNDTAKSKGQNMQKRELKLRSASRHPIQGPLL